MHAVASPLQRTFPSSVTFQNAASHAADPQHHTQEGRGDAESTALAETPLIALNRAFNIPIEESTMTGSVARI
jgi:hypothetical protein